MKSIESLSSAQRAKLLFDLFQAEMIEFIAYLTEIAQKIITDKEKSKSNSEEGIFPIYMWISLAEAVVTKIKLHEEKLSQSGSVFSEQLFSVDTSFFSKNYLLQFCTGQKVKATKFRQAVELFFK